MLQHDAERVTQRIRTLGEVKLVNCQLAADGIARAWTHPPFVQASDVRIFDRTVACLVSRVMPTPETHDE